MGKPVCPILPIRKFLLLSHLLPFDCNLSWAGPWWSQRIPSPHPVRGNVVSSKSVIQAPPPRLRAPPSALLPTDSALHPLPSLLGSFLAFFPQSLLLPLSGFLELEALWGRERGRLSWSGSCPGLLPRICGHLPPTVGGWQ